MFLEGDIAFNGLHEFFFLAIRTFIFYQNVMLMVNYFRQEILHNPTTSDTIFDVSYFNECVQDFSINPSVCPKQ